MNERFFIFLDLDNTVLDFTAAQRAALSTALAERGLEPTEAVLERYNELNIYCWEQLENGLWTRETVLVRRFELLFEELGLAQNGAEVSRRYEELLHRGHWFMPGAEALLRELAPCHELYLASNGVASVQRSRIASAGIEPYFKDIFISEDLGAVKPQRAFFEAAFARIPGFDPARALMVGDSLSSDIRGGINAGIRTCWFNPEKKPGREDIRPDWEIHSLGVVKEVLEKMRNEE